jgi:hypothetical protein
VSLARGSVGAPCEQSETHRNATSPLARGKSNDHGGKSRGRGFLAGRAYLNVSSGAERQTRRNKTAAKPPLLVVAAAVPSTDLLLLLPFNDYRAPASRSVRRLAAGAERRDRITRATLH